MTEGHTAGAGRGHRDRRTGTVVSGKREKTITVRFEYRVKHPKYGKYVRRSTTLQTHDEKNEAKVGDIVEVVACRRISKTKCWRLARVVRAASTA
ncbi:MAG: 30S ribosomal protein S17 [Phycisphaerae bacterium]